MHRLMISLWLLAFLCAGTGAQDPVDFNTLNRETYRLYLDQRWDSVIIMGKQALKQGMDFYYLRMRLGIAFYNKKEYRAAANHFSAALEQNQGDAVALEYLYYSRLLSGQSQQAGFIRNRFKGELADKLPPLKGRFLDQFSLEFLYSRGADEHFFEDPAELYPLGIEGNQSTTGYFLNGIFSCTNRIAPGVRLSHAFTYLSKINHYYTSDGTNAYYLPQQHVVQYQYYFSPELTTPSGTTFRPMIHWIGSSSQVPWNSGTGYQGGTGTATLAYVRKNQIVAGMGFRKGLGNLDLHLGAYYGNLNLARQVQGRLGLKWFPLGNLSFYLGGYANGQYESKAGTEGVVRIIPEMSLGFAPGEKVWIDLQGTIGEMTNYLENNGSIVYNSLDEVAEKRMKLSVSIPVSEQGSLLYLGSVLSTMKSDFSTADPGITHLPNSIHYNAISIYGGLLWKF